MERIAVAKWLNREFGRTYEPDDLPGGAHPKLTEHELDWHFTYSSVFNDPEVREKADKHKERLARKGIFSAMLELGSD